VHAAVHTTDSLISDAYAHQAPAGAFLTHTARGSVVAFPVNVYPGWGSAVMNVRYPKPGPAMPTPAVVRPTTSTVNPVPTLLSTVLTASLLPLLTDTFSTTTTVTSSTYDSASSKLAAGLEVLALAQRPPGVQTYPAGQSLPVSVAVTPTAQLPTVTTSATFQPLGSTTAATPEAPAPTTDIVATSGLLPVSTTALAVVTALPISISTVVIE